MMKKYHFYVTPAFTDGWLILERGKGNHFCLRLPTKYRAQLVANWLWKLWKHKHPNLENLKRVVCHPHYSNDWKRLKNLMLAYNV